jgi:beta-lactamase regulating signal transducer with metallopeptidase domain
MTFLLAVVIDITVVLTIALGLVLLLRGRSAALRHTVLTSALVAVALIPVLEALVPARTIFEWPAPSVVTSTGPVLTSDEPAVAAVDGVVNADEAFSPLTIVGAAWAAASLFLLAGLLTGRHRLMRLRKAAREVGGTPRSVLDEVAAHSGVRRPIKLLQTPSESLLVTYGTLAPGVIVPADADSWREDRWRVVLQHEVAHIARADAAIQSLAGIVRVMYPFHPLVWLACRQLRQHSEHACDDAVLRQGVRATDYATHLLELSQRLSARHTPWMSAPAIVHPSMLERRIVAMLQNHTRRTPVNRWGWVIAGLATAVITLPIAAASVAPATAVVAEPEQQPPAVVRPAALPTPGTTTPSAVVPPRRVAPQTATISGQVEDQTGGRIPGATVTLTDPQTGAQTVVRTNAPGRFSFPDVAPATYDLEVRMSGFKTTKMSLEAASGTVDRSITLQIGSLSETVTANCSTLPSRIWNTFFPVVSAQTQPIRIGGSIREPRKLKHVYPECPSGLATGEFPVHVRGRIDTGGVLQDLAVVDDEGKPAAHPDAAAAVIAAVQQWQFTPTELNGRPIDVTIDVFVTFKKN